jgi:serine/threonine protein kinase
MKAEAGILKSMKNDNIVNFRDVFESNDFIFLVMDHISEGSLSDLIQKRKFNDLECSQIIKSLLLGLRYIHSKDYIHRDLKPENILVKDMYDLSSVVIADFGLGTKQDMGFSTLLKGKCGTIIYMAPEQTANNNYGYSVDMWATGIIMYTLISGGHPLYKEGETDEDYLPKLTCLNWEFSTQFSPLAKDFFLKLCNKDPCNRYDAITALNHPWITRDFCAPIPRSLNEQMKEFIDIKQFIAVSRACLFIARMRSKKDIYAPPIITIPIEKSDTIELNREYFDDFPISFHTMKYGYSKNSMSSQNKSRIPGLPANKSEIYVLLNKDIANFDYRLQTTSKKEKPLSSNRLGSLPVGRKAATQKFKTKKGDLFQLRSVNMKRQQEHSSEIYKKEENKNYTQAILKPLTQRLLKNGSNPNLARKPPSKHIIL